MLGDLVAFGVVVALLAAVGFITVVMLVDEAIRWAAERARLARLRRRGKGPADVAL